MLGQMIRLKVCVFCSLFARAGVLLFDASLLCADVVDDKDHDDEKDAQIVALKKQLAALTVKPPKPKKVRVSKWVVKHNKVVKAVLPILPSVNTLDIYQLLWLSQHITHLKQKWVEKDSELHASVANYSRWISAQRGEGKLPHDVGDEGKQEEESEEEEEEEEEEEDGDD